MATEFVINSDTLSPGIKNLPAKIDRSLFLIMEHAAVRAQGTMKNEAPWTDRTGNARNSLTTTVRHGKGIHEVVLSHGVPYGIWLEVRWSGRYAIVKPTVEKEGARVMKSLEGMLNRLGRL